MMEQNPALPEPNAVKPVHERRERRVVIIISIILVVILLLLGLGTYGLTLNPATTQNIRDIFIIFMALVSIVIGAAMVILIIQVASLINLLNNEIKPILDATNETVANLRGTTQFLSENMVEPVLKLNSYLAGIQKLVDLLGMKRK